MASVETIGSLVYRSRPASGGLEAAETEAVVQHGDPTP